MSSQSTLVGDLIVSDEAGFACSKSKLVKSGVKHLRPFNIGNNGYLDLTEVYEVPETEVPKGKAKLFRGDILFNNTNSVEWVGKSALVPNDMSVGFSNHMTRIRLDQLRVMPEWFSYWLRVQQVRGFFAANSTQWVSQAAYRVADLKKIEIPLPDLEEQQRIVDILDRAASIQRLRKAADDKLKEIIPALFVDMFGDPATNPKGWQVSTVGELCTLVRGSSPRPQGDKRYFGGAVPRLMIADITRDGVYVTPKIDSLTELGATKSRPMRQGSVVMAVSGAVGLPAILDIDACIHDGFVGFRDLSANIKPEFLYWYIRSQKTVAASQAVGATFQNLTTDQIKQWVVPVPPLDKQDRFVTRVLGLNSNHMLSSNATLCTEAVIRSLSYQFFG